MEGWRRLQNVSTSILASTPSTWNAKTCGQLAAAEIVALTASLNRMAGCRHDDAVDADVAR